MKANKGAPGIDGMTVGDFPAFARVQWPRIAEAIREGTYRPAPVKRAWILREKVRCRKTLGLIRRYLMAGVKLAEGTREATPLGVPQGGPLSPLLANIALDPLDKELEARGHKFARYADDFIVLVKSAKAAARVMKSLTRYCEGRLRLVVNRAKSRTIPLKTCEFLGYRLNSRAKLAWTAKALCRFKERIRQWERSGHRLPAGQPRRGERSESNHPPQPRTQGGSRH